MVIRYTGRIEHTFSRHSLRSDVAKSYLEDALERYRSLGLIANEAGAVNSIANLHYKRKDYDKAIISYSQALVLFPEQAGYILRNPADSYIKLKDADRASHDLDMAAKLQPNNAYLYLRCGQLAILLRKYDQAIQYFTEALQLYPRLNYARFGIGVFHLRTGNLSEALKAYKIGLENSYSRDDLDEAIDELEELRREQILGVREIIRLLEDFKSF